MNIEKYISNTPVFQYRLIDSSEIVISQDVFNMCASNRCGKYGTCWTCPPATGSIEEIENKIRRFEKAFVFTCKHDLEDSFDFDGMMHGQKETRKVLDGVTTSLKNDGIKFMALGCEGCNICEKCTYPTQPCRYPERAFPSVEACGINVVELSRKIGVNYSNGANTVTYFCIIPF